ncbi:MAG: hypothetical protein JSS57_14560 [Proteobacteria bacterium]|nr:hypothetical protein [Pseudomonadota bacterium]
MPDLLLEFANLSVQFHQMFVQVPRQTPEHFWHLITDTAQKHQQLFA